MSLKVLRWGAKAIVPACVAVYASDLAPWLYALRTDTGIVNEHLREFLEISLPAVKPGKKSKFQLGVAETKLAGAIQEALNIRCVSNDVTAELFRGIRKHADKLISQFKEGDLAKAQLGLGHSFSRAKVRGGPVRTMLA